MYIEQMRVQSFRHLRDIELGPFREPMQLGELIILAGPNGGGKSSVLELLSFGLTSRYNWSYFQSRALTAHAFAIKVGLTRDEIETLAGEAQDPAVIEYAQRERGYWLQVNMPDVIAPADTQLNEQVHGLASHRYRQFARKLGFFIRADRGYGARTYDRNQLFSYKRRLDPSYFGSISYMQTTAQYDDMYDFLVEQSYHYVYDLGMHSLNQKRGIIAPEPTNPLAPYNELLGQLFPGYSFVDATAEDLTLRVRLPTGDSIPFQDMSSGEKEVFFLLSFFIRNDVTSSVIVIDEPELHLHPELARKLIRLMREIRPGNQIWCATHSAELIDEAGRDRTFYLRASEDRAHSECLPATVEGADVQILRDMFGVSGYVGIWLSRSLWEDGRRESCGRDGQLSWRCPPCSRRSLHHRSPFTSCAYRAP